MTTRLHDYAEVRAYLEKEHPDWLRALTRRLLVPESLGRLIDERCDAEFRQHPRTPDQPQSGTGCGSGPRRRYSSAMRCLPTTSRGSSWLPAADRVARRHGFCGDPVSIRCLGLHAAEGNLRHAADGDCLFFVCHEPPKDRTFPDDRGPDAGITAEPSSWSSGVDKFHSSTLIVGL